MYIDIYTFSSKPKNVDISQYKLDNHLSEPLVTKVTSFENLQ